MQSLNIYLERTWTQVYFAMTCLLEFGLHAKVVHDEGVDVGVFLNHFAEGHTATMACLGLNTDEFRGVAGVGSLQSGSIFEGMCWHYTVVMIGSGEYLYRYSNISLLSALVP